jgi:hypothetical protein
VGLQRGWNEKNKYKSTFDLLASYIPHLEILCVAVLFPRSTCYETLRVDVPHPRLIAGMRLGLGVAREARDRLKEHCVETSGVEIVSVH